MGIFCELGLFYLNIASSIAVLLWIALLNGLASFLLVFFLPVRILYFVIARILGRKSNIRDDGTILSKQKIEGGLYRFESILGKGAFGTVYKCFKIPSGTVVAIKKIENKDACWTEVEIMEKLQGHEYVSNFVQCFNIHRTEAAMYLVMEFCPDGSLEQYIRKNGIFKDSNVQLHVAHLIRGLCKMHKLGLMHRDLKPGNILVARNKKDNGIILKIADFGISKEVVSNLAIYQTLCGTLCYMAPYVGLLGDWDWVYPGILFVTIYEVLQGHRYDKTADVYSLGGVFFFMRRGRHPIGLHFDKCGYAAFTDRAQGYGHKSITGRMMCQRKEERLKLDELISKGDTFYYAKAPFCAICKKLLE